MGTFLKGFMQLEDAMGPALWSANSFEVMAEEGEEKSKCMVMRRGTICMMR